MSDHSIRPGETALGFDPAAVAADAHLIFIGRIRSPWSRLSDCPKNLREARTLGSKAWIEIDIAFRQGLIGLADNSHIIVLSWLHGARRDLIELAPRHVASPRGVFALRSPIRPNPIAVDLVRLVTIDASAGRLEIDAIDLLDGTPVVDIKPYLGTIDSVPPG